MNRCSGLLMLAMLLANTACASRDARGVGENVSMLQSKPLQSGFAPIHGINMYYEVHGRSDGIPLVLLHGGHLRRLVRDRHRGAMWRERRGDRRPRVGSACPSTGSRSRRAAGSRSTAVRSRSGTESRALGRAKTLFRSANGGPRESVDLDRAIPRGRRRRSQRSKRARSVIRSDGTYDRQCRVRTGVPCESEPVPGVATAGAHRGATEAAVLERFVQRRTGRTGQHRGSLWIASVRRARSPTGRVMPRAGPTTARTSSGRSATSTRAPEAAGSQTPSCGERTPSGGYGAEGKSLDRAV